METLSEAIERIGRQIARIEAKENERKLRLVQTRDWLKELQMRRIKDKVERERKIKNRKNAEKQHSSED